MGVNESGQFVSADQCVYLYVLCVSKVLHVYMQQGASLFPVSSVLLKLYPDRLTRINTPEVTKIPHNATRSCLMCGICKLGEETIFK